MRRILFFVVLALTTFVGTIALAAHFFLGLGGNFGYHFGYYGKFNQIYADLQSTENIQIIDYGIHQDLTLEDFWIDINLNGELHQLEFRNSNIRSVKDLRTEYSELIEPDA